MSPEAVGVIMLLGGLICSGGAIYVQRHRQAVASRSLTAILSSSAVWAAFYGFELIAHDASTKQLLGNLKYVGITFLPLSWLLFSFRFTGRGDRITRRVLILLAAEPVLLLGLLALPATQELIRYYPDPPLEPFPIVSTGPLYWVNAVYLNILAIAATVLFLVTLSRHPPQYRRQRSWLAVAYLLPWIPNLAHNLGIGPAEHLDLTPVALAISGPILVWGFFRSRLVDLAPVARRHVVENMPDGVIVLDTYHRVVDHNPASGALLNMPEVDLIGMHIAQLFAGVGPALEPRGGIGTHRVSIPSLPDMEMPDPGTPNVGAPRAATASRVLEIEITPLGGTASSSDRSAGYLVILRDDTERLANEERLQRLAHHDPLTGLPNRKLLGDRLDHALAHARRNNSSFALLFLDLDRFKMINDALGHETGDLLLRQVADRLNRCLRDEDTIARVGGDEFVVLLAEVSRRVDAERVAEKLIEALDQPFVVRDRDLRVTASIGVAHYPLDGIDLDRLMTAADNAMYVAKAQGKNRVHGADDPTSTTFDREHIESDLRSALEHDQLDLDFQPCLAIGTSLARDEMLTQGTALAQQQNIISLEALARWHHPQQGTIPPDVFIPLAEEAGLMPALGLWALERCCRQIATWRDEYGTEVSVSVNISDAQLGCLLLVHHVEEALANSGLAPGRLVLEISERTTALVTGPVIAELEALHRRGVRLALDHFGMGNTSRAGLSKLRFDQLKIDGSFIRKLSSGADNPERVAAMIEFGHSLDMQVIAKGVEHPEELEMLRALGCDAVQGYLLGQPLSAEATTAMLVP